MKNPNSASWRSLIPNFERAPMELKTFIIFCTIVPILSIIITFILPKSIQEQIIPVTGWNMGLTYFFNLFLTIMPMISSHRKVGLASTPYANVFMLVLMVIFGVKDLLRYDGGYEGNPYLSHSPYRSLWTIVLPIIWMIIFLSPRIKSYYQSLGPQSGSGILQN